MPDVDKYAQMAYDEYCFEHGYMEFWHWYYDVYLKQFKNV